MRTVFVALAILVAATAAHGAGWDTIEPGKSTLDTIRARFGEPLARKAGKVDGYDTTEWVYEGERSPRGIRRLTIDFGLLLPEGFKPGVVRSFSLEPAPGVFSPHTIVKGWGEPSGIGRSGEFPALAYDDGLLVIFELDGRTVRQMIFTMPRKKN